MSVVSSDAEDVEERPQIIQQARKASKTRKTKYPSYRTLNDDAYSSDMDDLCDPDFYLTYTTGTTTQSVQTKPATTTAMINGGAKSVELPRRAAPKKQPSLESAGSRDLDVLNDIFQSTAGEKDRFMVARKEPPKSATSWGDALDREEYGAKPHRSTRSVTSTPVQKHRHFGVDRYDALTDAEGTDNWLEQQLDKLRFRRDMDPDVQRRKKQEKLLLEELKHVNDDRNVARGRHEADYSVEGVGLRQMDPLEEYRMEEERLRNLKSPYGDNSMEPRMVVGPSGKHPSVKGKPPTPPPRERSRTPPSPRRMSPVGRKGAPASVQPQYGRHTPSAPE
uniref:Uncharacterized protein n=1 Tax=Plectus sambesii TaxID=2011161 RepID=A0A914VCC7_9BILA